jgi:hypothetical protein
MDAANDPVHVFLMEAHNICMQAQFVVDSLPNSDLPAVECSTRQLGAVSQIVAEIDDPAFTEDVWEELIATLNGLLGPLEDFIARSTTPATHHTTSSLHRDAWTAQILFRPGSSSSSPQSWQHL